MEVSSAAVVPVLMGVDKTFDFVLHVESLVEKVDTESFWHFLLYN